MQYDLVKGPFDDGPWNTNVIAYLSGSTVFSAAVSSAADPDGPSKTLTATHAATMIDTVLASVTFQSSLSSVESGFAHIFEAEIDGVGAVTC
jgi:hypothetical protein